MPTIFMVVWIPRENYTVQVTCNSKSTKLYSLSQLVLKYYHVLWCSTSLVKYSIKQCVCYITWYKLNEYHKHKHVKEVKESHRGNLRSLVDTPHLNPLWSLGVLLCFMCSQVAPAGLPFTKNSANRGHSPSVSLHLHCILQSFLIHNLVRCQRGFS